MEESSVYLELSDDGDFNEDIKIVSISPEDMKLPPPKKLLNNIYCHEPGCSAEYKFLKKFRNHLVEAHNYDMNSEKLTFTSLHEFEKWRTEYEQKNLCSFVKRTGSRVNRNQAVSMYLYCSRSGGEFVSKGSTIGKIKKSNRSNVVCTASIVYRVLTDGDVNVILYPNHYGHEIDLKKLPLSKQDRDVIAKELGDGASPSAIIDKLTSSSGGKDANEPLKRIDMVNINDIKKIEKAYNIITPSTVSNNCIEDDFESLDVWCAELGSTRNNSSSPVLYYKPLGYKSDSLSPYDLCLVLMTEYMRNMLVHFGDKLIYATTLPIPKIHYYATMLFIIDEFNNPFPVIVMLTNKSTNVYFKLLYEILNAHMKNKNIELSTKIFMTDRNISAFNHWNRIMNLQSKHMICPMFIDNEWRKYLATISNEELQCEIYDQLCELLEPTDQNSQSMLNFVLKNLESNDMFSKFLSYFNKFYTNTFDEWGGYRIKQLLNISSSLNFEKTISDIQITLDAKYKKYAKNIVKILQQFLKKLINYQYSRITKINSVVTATESNHRASLEIDLKNVYPVEDNKMWRVVLDKENIVRRNEYLPRCCNSEELECSMSCKQCEVCIHKMICTCNDFKNQTSVCIHIHLVIRLLRHRVLYNVIKDTNCILNVDERDSIKIEPKEEPDIEIESEVNTINFEQPSNDIASLRKSIIQTLASTEDKLYLVQDKTKLQSLLKIVEELYSLTNEMSCSDTTKRKKPLKKQQCIQKNLKETKIQNNSHQNLQKTIENNIQLEKVGLKISNVEKNVLSNIETYQIVRIDPETKALDDDDEEGTEIQKMIPSLEEIENDELINQNGKNKKSYENSAIPTPLVSNLKPSQLMEKKLNLTPNHKKNTNNSNFKLDKPVESDLNSSKFWDIEISCKDRKVSVPIYDKNNIKTEIERTIEAIQKNAIFFPNIFDMSLPSVLLNSNKQMTILQLNNILKNISNNKSISESSMNNGHLESYPIEVKLKEKLKSSSQLTLKRKIEQFSKENEILKKEKKEEIVKSDKVKGKKIVHCYSKKMKNEINVSQNDSLDKTNRKIVSIGNKVKINKVNASSNDSVKKTMCKNDSNTMEDIDQSNVSKENKTQSKNMTDVEMAGKQNENKILDETMEVDSFENSSLKAAEEIEDEKEIENLNKDIVEEKQQKKVQEENVERHSKRNQEKVKEEVLKDVIKKEEKTLPNTIGNQTEKTNDDKDSELLTKSEKMSKLDSQSSKVKESTNEQSKQISTDLDSNASDTKNVALPSIEKNVVAETSRKEKDVTIISKEKKDVFDSCTVTNEDLKASTSSESNVILKKTVPKRVVRTLRPQLQNELNSPSRQKGCLKVLKPCPK